MYADSDFIMSPKVDFVFKELMRVSQPMRKSFISAVLGIDEKDIKSLILFNSSLPKGHESEKQGILDVRLCMNDDTEIDIEIQLGYSPSWSTRSIFYVSKLLVEQSDINRSYSNFKKCVGINILDFNYIKDTDRYHTVYHFREDSEDIKYSDIMEIHIIELPKAVKGADGSTLSSWIDFLKVETREEVDMLSRKDESFKSACDALKEISSKKDERLIYDARKKALLSEATQVAETKDEVFNAFKETLKLSKADLDKVREYLESHKK